MGLFRRRSRSRSDGRAECPYCGQALLLEDGATDGVCAGCAWQLERRAAPRNGTSVKQLNGSARTAFGQSSTEEGRSGALNDAPRDPPIAAYVPGAFRGPASPHRCTGMETLERELAHTRELLGEIRRQRDFLAAELEAMGQRLDATVDERRGLLELLNHILCSHPAARQPLITSRLELPLLGPTR